MLRSLRTLVRSRCLPAATLLRRVRGEEGSLFEYAIVFILFMTMVLGIVEFSRALYVYHFVSHEAREAARWAAVNGSTCTGDSSCTAPISSSSAPCTLCTSGCTAATLTDVQNFVRCSSPWSTTSNLTITACGVSGQSKCSASVPTTCTATVNGPGCTVQVQVSYPFTFIFPFVYRNTLTLSSTSDMIIAH
jgi:Flp pilus assembly protein TadG